MSIGSNTRYGAANRDERPRGKSPGAGVMWMPDEIESALEEARETGDFLHGELEEGLDKLRRTQRKHLFGQYLTEWRHGLNLGAGDAAELLGVPRQTYQNVEWGNNHFSDEIVKRIAPMLRVDGAWLVEFSHQSAEEHRTRKARKATRGACNGMGKPVSNAARSRKEPRFRALTYLTSDVISWLEARAELRMKRTGESRPSLAATLNSIVVERYLEDLKKPDSPVWKEPSVRE